MNTKILLLLIGGMSLSFVLILGITMSIVGDGRSDRTPQTSKRRIVLSERVNPTPRTAPAPVPSPKQTTRSHPEHAHSSPYPSFATEQVTAKATDSIQRAQPTSINPPEEQTLKPDPETLREFSTLKGELRREIGVLKKDRDAMLRSLAEVLARQAPATIAQEVRSLDDEMVAQTLRYFKPEKRQPALAGIDPQRADRIRRRLSQLGER